MNVYRSGIGIDTGHLKAGRKLVLGGVGIEHTKGLGAHSSADALVHAIIDALLGAAALGDFGRCFPEHEKKRKRSSSLKLLDATANLLKEEDWHPVSIGAAIIAEVPKLSDYFRAMEKNVAKSLKLKKSLVNIQAASAEKMGFAESGAGVAAFAVAMISR